MKNLIIKIIKIVLACYAGLIILVGALGIAGALNITSNFAQIIFIISGAILLTLIFLKLLPIKVDISD